MCLPAKHDIWNHCHKGEHYDEKYPVRSVNAPIARDEMDTAAFDAVMSERQEQAKAGQGLPLENVFSLLRKDV